MSVSYSHTRGELVLLKVKVDIASAECNNNSLSRQWSSLSVRLPNALF